MSCSRVESPVLDSTGVVEYTYPAKTQAVPFEIRHGFSLGGNPRSGSMGGVEPISGGVEGLW